MSFVRFRQGPYDQEGGPQGISALYTRPYQGGSGGHQELVLGFDTIEPEVEAVKLSHSLKIRLIAEARIKTDKVDSQTNAELLRTNFLPTCYVPDPETRQQKELFRHRAFLIKMHSGFKNCIHAAPDKAGVEHPFDNIFTNSGLEFLKTLKLQWAYQRELKDCPELIEILSQKEKEQNRLIERLCKHSAQASLLTTIPGIGYHSALLVANELVEPVRFVSGERFVSYCGLITSVRISDRSVYYGNITKQGNRWLRWVFTEAAHIARRRSLRLGQPLPEGRVTQRPAEGRGSRSQRDGRHSLLYVK